jgi:hypothetical protein
MYGGEGASYTTSSQISPTLAANNIVSYGATGTFTTSPGTIKPQGGFISKNRNFLYLMNNGPLSSGDPTHFRLLAVNIRSVDTSANLNGRTDFRAAGVTQPTRYGFKHAYYYYGGMYGSSNYYYTTQFYYNYRALGGQNISGATHHMARNGVVFYTADYQANGTGQMTYLYWYPAYTYTFMYAGPVVPTYYGYGYYGNEILAFQADAGGSAVFASNIGPNSTSVRMINYMEVDRSGENIAFGYTTYSSLFYKNQELLYSVRDFRMSPTTGAVISSPRRVQVETTTGRLGEAMAFHSLKDRLYYGFKSGGTDENAMELVEAKFGAGTSVTFRRMTSPTRRYHVLNCGR